MLFYHSDAHTGLLKANVTESRQQSETSNVHLSGEPLQQPSPADTQEAALGSGTLTFLYIEQFLKIAL